jgi:hypothetical protein
VRLLDIFQPNLLKISKAVISKLRLPNKKPFLFSSLVRIEQLLIQKAPLKITCKYELGFDVWKTTSFLLSQMA